MNAQEQGAFDAGQGKGPTSFGTDVNHLVKEAYDAAYQQNKK